MIINLVQKTVGETKPKGPTASLTPASGVTYTEGFTGLDAETVSLFCGAISNNAAINNETGSVYIDYENEHRKFSIGDQVSLPLNGTSYAFDIIGFNHDVLTDAAVYGEATATGKAGITFQMHDLYATTYQMNSTNTNIGGWENSAMRTSTMATMKSYLPSAWQPIVKDVNKKTSAGNQSATINTSADDCFLLAEIEIFGSTNKSASGEGSQYAYYKAGNSKIKNKSGSATYWWERSPTSSGRYGFCRVTSSGSADSNGSSYSYGVAFGFCV